MAPKRFLYIGTYAPAQDPGIYIYEFDEEDGQFRLIEGFSGIENPSFLTPSHDGRFLYAVSETDTYEGKPGGSVAAFAIDPQQGTLTFLNREATLGRGPCHLVADRSGSCLIVANYTGGSASVFPLLSDGKIGQIAQLVQHEGHGVNPSRQEGPHVHSAFLSPGGQHVLLCDLGIDTISSYTLDRKTCHLELCTETKAEPGAGPRHLAFHPSGKFVYVINELNSTIVAYRYELENGALQPLQTVSTLPEGFEGENTGAEICVHPSGELLYGSNRGDDSIVAFRIDPQTGLLSFIERASVQGKTPRNFSITPNGRFLLVANQDSNSVIVFSLDPDTGHLGATGEALALSHPVCLKFV
ncbi:6-phosphogluconolactonase [Thermosporothrix hazakensis]|jgi:6-phosphogluconolactonase|uniref:6-phosphogluconolactonase n=1 Tax=Thermosporothrix hazakensis TaxID=644383 RepID=A0A326UC85_THEHA|nr:lactonase family protein [Thermosporothrix hazakensis]PZW34279.1 6-phosphogluconolactonase [Thermosporothrix hazakensis]GCE46168.1 3-carboxymuconate cyclase [Thermosporothrix hazakensis]